MLGRCVVIREDSWLAGWLSLPWRCKFGRHDPLWISPYYTDTDPPYPDGDPYYECGRCQAFLGWIEELS